MDSTPVKLYISVYLRIAFHFALLTFLFILLFTHTVVATQDALRVSRFDGINTWERFSVFEQKKVSQVEFADMDMSGTVDIVGLQGDGAIVVSYIATSGVGEFFDVSTFELGTNVVTDVPVRVDSVRFAVGEDNVNLGISILHDGHLSVYAGDEADYFAGFRDHDEPTVRFDRLMKEPLLWDDLNGDGFAGKFTCSSFTHILWGAPPLFVLLPSLLLQHHAYFTYF